MDKFLSGYKKNVDNNEDSDADINGNKSKKEGGYSSQEKKNNTVHWQDSQLLLQMSWKKRMSLLCLKVLASYSMRQDKLKRHHETVHSEYVRQPIQLL